MIKRFGILTVLLAIVGLAFYVNSRPQLTKAQQATQTYWCPSNVQSTQARVQNNVQTPWAANINVGCERTFNVGSFHNNTGVFATDTVLQVGGPNNFVAFYNNGDSVTLPQHAASGTYTLYVNTKGQFDPGRCSGQATVTYTCNSAAAACNYGSTQARVQQNDQSPWSKNLNLSCGDVFEVGSFHDGNGSQFATDTRLWVSGPQGLNQEFKNDDKIRALFPGRYTLSVTTPGQSGPACQETAVVDVTCGEWWQAN